MKVILCDDHPIVVLSQSMLLERAGHEIVGTADHSSSLPELVDHHQPDVCLMDLFFDDEPSCLTALATIGEICRSTDVVVVTGAASESRDAAAAAGASVVVSKSASGTQLLAVVEGRSGDCIDLRTPSPVVGNPYLLTQREREVLQRLVEGDSTVRMAANLGMRHATARSHVQSVLLKLGVHSRSAAVAMVVDRGLIPFTL